MSKAEQRTQRIHAAFEISADNFYKNAHDIAPLTGGEDNITQTAAVELAHNALIAIKEDGVEIRGMSPEEVAPIITYKLILSRPSQEEKEELLKHEGLYNDIFEDALYRILGERHPEILAATEEKFKGGVIDIHSANSPDLDP
ncbi:MAG: hypothetical protein AAF204_02515 [Pseudomonadota bacterium]